MDAFSINSDILVSWTLTDRRSGEAVTGATVTGTLTRGGTTLWSGSLAEDPAGTYWVSIPASASSGLDDGDVAVLELTAISGSSERRSRIELTAVARP